MALSIDELPNDIESLKALLVSVHAESLATEAKAASLAAEVDRLTARAARLDHIVSVLRRAQFGRRSERISDEQIELALEDVETQHGVEDAGAEKADAIIKAEGVKARRPNRGHLPPHLPREEIIIEPEAKACPAAEGVFVDDTHRRARSLTESVRSLEIEKWGKDHYALELDVPIDANLRIDKELVICIPARQVKRKLAPDDFVHIECQEGRLTAPLIRRVELNPDGELVFANVHNRNMVLPSKTKIRGLVGGRIMTMK